MHILVLPSWYPSKPVDGNGSFFREHAIALKKHGHMVGVIHPFLHSLRGWKNFLSVDFGIHEELDFDVQTLRSIGIAWIPKKIYISALIEFYHGLRLYKKYSDKYGRPDVIHVQSMLNAGRLAMYLKRKYNIPYVITEHSWRHATGRVSSNELKLSKLIASNAVYRFGVSRSLCNELEELIGLDSGQWCYFPNMVEHTFFETPLKESSKSEKPFRFICVASLDQNKCVDHVIKAFFKILIEGDDIYLDIVGDGPDRNKLESMSDEMGIADRVKFYGKRNRKEILEVMSSADSLVLASRYETFGVVIIEALALGKPVVATKCGGPESIIRKEDGLLVPTDDISALCDAMTTVRTNFDQYDPYEIRIACKNRFSEEVIISGYTEIYESVIKN